ncbi:TnpV protein [Phascolarctobacterium sp.]|uniref:TnpV protein n=1 Tax=Phascolarctobacterium sp. TaxID=2049039 RepID=UPI00386922FF
MQELKRRISENGIEYVLVGDYYLPEMKLPEEKRSIGHYGRLHREYLRQVKPMVFDDLILTGQLWSYLADLNEQATERRNVMMQQLMEKENVTEELKQKNRYEWVRRMNGIRSRVDEIIMKEMIYC